MIHALCCTSASALPRRLVLALDGVSYRDMKVMQDGMTYTNWQGRPFHRQAFHEGYFPVSRNISTFPSTSDVAWTDIFGNRPLPGYQRTYFSTAENREIIGNSITSSMEHERQMHWQMESDFRRFLAYRFPVTCFKYELSEVTEKFMASPDDGGNYYAYIHSTDEAQHLSGNILYMLGLLDAKLKELCARYQARTGHDLEILILSDHGHNHAGAGKRVGILGFLKNAGYRVGHSIENPKDVVLPTCGIESWVEIHNTPAETEKLAQLFCHMEGVDVVTARLPNQTNRFLVMNSKGERAVIEWNSVNNSFRYSTELGDPIDYRPVVAALAKKNRLDSAGFAPADDWMAETMTHHYPLALERIVRGLTCITRNPANVLISLNNGYVHADWLIKRSSQLVTLGGTHGGLDDINSDGMVLSNFTPTRDTSTSRVAALFDDFQGLRVYRAGENGAEWITGKGQALTRIPRMPLDAASRRFPDEAVFLRVWSPEFARLDVRAPIEVKIEKVPRYTSARIHRWDPKPEVAAERHLPLNLPISFPNQCAYERVYSLPSDWMLEPGKSYRISGRVRGLMTPAQIFNFAFRTDSRGIPVPN